MFNYRLDATLCSRILRDLRDGPLHRASRTSTTVEHPLSSRVHVCNQAIHDIAKEIAQLVDLKFGPEPCLRQEYIRSKVILKLGYSGEVNAAGSKQGLIGVTAVSFSLHVELWPLRRWRHSTLCLFIGPPAPFGTALCRIHSCIDLSNDTSRVSCHNGECGDAFCHDTSRTYNTPSTYRDTG